MTEACHQINRPHIKVGKYAEEEENTVNSTTTQYSTLSTMPASFASFAPICRPLVIRSMAIATPASLGNRWVPDAPGRMPIFTSGKPNLKQNYQVKL